MIKRGRELITFWGAVCVVMILLRSTSVYGQISTGNLGDSNVKAFTAGGSIGFTTQAYQAFGISNRQPALLARGDANVSFSLFGIHSGLNLLYSSDDSRLRQSMNRLGFSGSWHWVHLEVGDVSPQMGKYSLNGATMRGGYLKLTPGPFHLELAAGRSQRAVHPGPDVGLGQVAYRRWMMSGAIGFGRKEKSHFLINALYAIDDKNSLDTTATITPQENLELTPDFGLSLFKGAFRVSSQVTVSVYTRDLNAKMLDLSGVGVPSFVTNLFKPRTGTRINYAGDAKADLDLDVFGLSLGYKRIQPGFTSLGLSQIRDDQQTVSVAPKFKLFKGRLTMTNTLSLGKDNLNGTRLTTQKTTQFGTNLQTQLNPMFTITASYNFFMHQITPTPGVADSLTMGLGQKQLSNNIMFQPTLSIQAGTMVHTISLSLSYLTLNTKLDQSTQPGLSTVPNNFGSNTYTGTVSYSVSLPSGMGINASLNYMKNHSSSIDISNIGLNTGVSYNLFQNKVTLAVNGGYNKNNSEPKGTMIAGKMKMAQITGNGSAAYRLTGKDTFNLSVRFMNNQILQGNGQNFKELVGRFQYRHRF